MAIQVLQKPSDIQAAQSPIVFAVSESIAAAVTSSEFQYTANLYVWSGAPSDSGSYIYQARKYPNLSGSGIFDFNRMINSTLTDLAATNSSNIKYYKVDFGWQYASGSSYVTQSGAMTQVTTSLSGNRFKAYDGYNIFPQQINSGLVSSSYFPVMTDAGNVTQSVLMTDVSSFGTGDLTANQATGSKGIPVWRGTDDKGNTAVTIHLTASYTNGTKASGSTSSGTSQAYTTQIVGHYGFCPNDIGWSGRFPTVPTASLDTYKFVFTTGSTGAVLATLNYEVVCQHYYVPVRIAWKNRYGQFDFLNFYKRHNETFNTDQRLYQPQLGTWQSSTLSYNQFQTSQQRYIVDATQVLDVNTDWLPEGYNELFKQLMVSDEIYWMYDQSNPNNVLVKPLTIKTNSLQFKTGVNNKLIQYTLSFDIGQPYKLLL
jgi:hypothetical protein